MKRKDVIEFASQLKLGPPSKEYRAKWVNYKCPWASTRHSGGTDKSKGFGISCDNGLSNYFCLGCKAKGAFPGLAYTLGRERGDKSYTAIGQEIQRTEILGPRVVPKPWSERFTKEEQEDEAEAPFTYPSPAAEYSYPSAIGQRYLAERGIGFTATIGLRLRFDPVRRRVLFPVYDPRGAFVGFSGRAIDPPASYDDGGKPLDRRGYPYIKVRDYLGLRKRDFLLGEHRAFAHTANGTLAGRRNRAHRSPSKGAVIVVEGLFDYAWLRELGYTNVICVMGSWFSAKRLARIKRYGRPLILFMDNDVAGFEAIDIIKAQLWGSVPLYGVDYPHDILDADPATLPPGIIHNMIRNKRLFTEAPAKELLTKYNPSYTL